MGVNEPKPIDVRFIEFVASVQWVLDNADHYSENVCSNLHSALEKLEEDPPIKAASDLECIRRVQQLLQDRGLEIVDNVEIDVRKLIGSKWFLHQFERHLVSEEIYKKTMSEISEDKHEQRSET